MEISAVLQLLKDRRDALNITIAILEDEHSRHARVVKSTKRAMRQVGADAPPVAPVNGHGPIPRGAKQARILALLSSHPMPLATVREKTGFTAPHASGALWRLQKDGLAAKTAKGWVKK